MSDDVAPMRKPATDKPLAAVPALPFGLTLPSLDAEAWLFTLTTFLSALLLFSVQPMFAKMVLPILGGAPSVWAVSMLFFQGALLAGYSYAHILNTRFAPSQTGWIHLGLFALAALVSLPIGLPLTWREPPTDPYLWQLALFAVAVGLPFLAVSANAPLLQAWFARTGHADGRDPYFLYAASNLGSFVALLGYAFVLEPAFGVRQLSRAWTVGFILLALAIATCFMFVLRSNKAGQVGDPDLAADAPTSPAPDWPHRLGWTGLAFVPSALLTAFTTHVATDVASAPLIWVIPLSIYLLTFVLVFRDKPMVFVPVVALLGFAGPPILNLMASPWGTDMPNALAAIGIALAAAGLTWLYRDRVLQPTQWMQLAQLVAVILALLQLSQTRHDNWFISGATGLAAFFTSAMVAHRTLYDSRPDARHLTEFYMWMSLGGVLGGLFSALIAPKLFTEVYEYPILLGLAMACRPGALALDLKDRDEQLKLWLIAAACILTLFWLPWATRTGRLDLGEWGATPLICLILAIAIVVFQFMPNFPRRQLIAALMMCAAVVELPSAVNHADALEKKRSYFGVYRVSETSDGEYHILTHGTTLHGAQRFKDDTGKPVVDTTPGTYYHPKSPMAKSIELVRARLLGEGKVGQYGVVGLGTGSLACLSRPEEKWRFFEIDPTIWRITSNPANFSYLSTCQPGTDIVWGDARLTMAKQPPESFDLIIVDAFSSDAIPVHLLTADAMRMFATKLTPKGVLVLHISNRYLDLDSVLGANAPLVPELKGVILSDDESDGSYASTTSTIGVFTKDDQVIAAFRDQKDAVALDAKGLRGWTDDFSDVLGPFLSKLK